MEKIIGALTIFLFTQLAAGQNGQVLSYVDKYKEIAIEEMHRTGIPASIKLGQGILESNAGQSDLALRSNNHFGLKCDVNWTGETYYKKDDDYDRRGRLIKSCFRAFDDPETSFIEHSSFLLSPRKSYRYGFLFSLDRYDYKSWAWGLKQSGYATNPKYAVLLINIIETYELYQYDYYEPRGQLVSSDPDFVPELKPTYQHERLANRKLRTTHWKTTATKIEVIDGLVTNNGLDMLYAREGDTPASLAKRYQVDIRDILANNERLIERDQPLMAAERVYLDKKKKAYKGSKKFHVVAEGETMYDIAQAYGILLERLYIRNRMFPGTEPAYGERVILRGMVKSRERPKLRAVPSVTSDLAVSTPRAREGRQHVVRRGETLFGIANQYRVSVKSLVKKNELESNLILPGQVLNVGN